jgi:hypothetical protein
MPLLPGKQNIGRNITELEQHGTRPRSHQQILAIALSTARKSGARKSGARKSGARIPPPKGSRFSKPK